MNFRHASIPIRSRTCMLAGAWLGLFALTSMAWAVEYVRWRDGEIIYDTRPGIGGSHGRQHEFVVETRAPDHPIMRGLPPSWMHAQDELYAELRGLARSLTVLATAYSAPDTGGTGEHEPMLITVRYGEGRIPLHSD